MTAITLLGGDFELLLDDENNQNGGTAAVAGMRAIVRPNSGTTTTVYTTNQLYSAVADVTDDVVAMGFRNPMLPVTPNAYTIENKYFIQRRATEFLKEGAITNDHTVATGDGVYRKVYASVTAAPVDADIGRQVTEATSGDTGTLLDFETEPDGTTVLWIRPDTSGDTFALSTALTCTGDGGTCNVTGSGAATSGITKYAAVQAIGSVPAATDVYLYQDRVKMTNYTGGFQWWATNPAVNLGIISILIRTQNAGTLIADGDVEVFARRYTSLYDNFRLNVAAGGFSALPLASAADINNTTGINRVTTNAGTLTVAVGDVLRKDGAGNENQKMVVTAISGTSPNYTIDYYETGTQVAFANTDVIEDLGETGTLTINSAPTPTPNGPTETGAGNGATVTVSIGHYDVDHSGDGTTEPYSIQVDAQGDVPIATVYEVLKYRTRRGADEAALFGAGTNVPGESYRGIDGFFEYDAATGTLGSGEDIFTTTGGNTWTARLVGQSTGTSPTYITVTDQQTSLDSVVDNDVIEDEAGTEDVTVHAGGSQGLRSITSPKSSPFGTFTGTQIFGAPGVVFINPAGADTQNYILTDDFGVLNNPPNTIQFTVTNLATGDRVIAAQQSATAGIIEKDVTGIWGLVTPAASYNRLGDSEIRVDGAITASEDVPASGTLRVVDIGQKEEHLYYYSSRTLGTPGIFTLTSDTDFTGTADATTSDTQLVDAASSWTTGTTPEVGMMVRNVTNGGDVYEITSVAATTLGLKKLYGSGDTFASGDSYEINKVIGGDHTAAPANYGADDGIYLTYIDDESAAGGDLARQFIKSTGNNFTMVVNVRNGKTILPFTTNQLQQDDSVTVTTVRQPDTIAT